MNRRKFLQATGVGITVGVAGCAQDISPITDSSPATPSFDDRVEAVTVEQISTSSMINRSNFILLSEDLIDELGVENYQQVRVEVENGSQPFLYTVRTDREITEEDEKVAKMTQDGLQRIGLGSQGGTITITPFAPNPEITTQSEAESLNEFIEQSVDGSDNLIACAPQGGHINPKTDRQALEFSSEAEYTSWFAAGYDDEGAAEDRWRVEPELLNVTSFFKLNELVTDNEYTFAVSFLKLPSEVDADVVIGGLAPTELKETYQSVIAETIPDQYEVTTQTDGEHDGSDPGNFVNEITESGTRGIQISQSGRVLNNQWQEIATACITAHEDYLD